MFQYSIRKAVFTGFILICIASLALGCTEGRPIEQDPEFNGLNPSEVVLATVGGKPITLALLLRNFEFHGMLDDNLIKPEVFRQEAASRGVMVTQEEIDALYQTRLAEQGGYAEWRRQVEESSPFIPMGVLPGFLRNQTSMDLLSEAIQRDVYENDRGGMTREEARVFLETAGQGAKERIAAVAGVQVEMITIDNAWEPIEDEFSHNWIQSHDWATEMNSWREDLTVINYVRMAVETEGFFDEPENPVPVNMDIDMSEVTLARVGDKPITLADYMELPMLYAILDQVYIRHELLLQEVAFQQLEVDEAVIEEKYQEIIAQQGGEEQILGSSLEILPKPTILPTVWRMAEMDILHTIIFEAYYAREHGPLTREEAEAFIDGAGQYVRNEIALESDKEPHEVTVDDAWETVEQFFMQDWLKDPARMTLILNEIQERHPVVNIIRLLVDDEELPVELEVPSLDVESGHEGEESEHVEEEVDESGGQEIEHSGSH